MDSIQVFDSRAADYARKFMDLDWYNAGYQMLCTTLAPKATVLELGSGPGMITRYLLQQRPDLLIDATDASPAMVALAQQHNPTAHCFVWDARRLNELTGKYAAIICGFVMPYLTQEENQTLISTCAAKLPSGGLFYVSIIEAEYEASRVESSSDGKDQCMVYYYPFAYIEEELKHNGLELIYQERIHNPERAGQPGETQLVCIAQKK